MENIRELLGKPLVVGVLGGIVGLILGLIVGWGIWPVNYTDATIKNLRPDLQKDYLKMSIDSFGRNKDQGLAQLRWKEMGPEVQKLLPDLSADPSIKPSDFSAFTTLMQTGAPAAGTQPAKPEATKPAGEATQEPVEGQPTMAVVPPATTAGKGPNWTVLLGVFCLLTLIIGGALVYILVLRKRGGAVQKNTPAHQANEANRAAARTDFAAAGQEPPTAQFMTTYMIGDDLYDDSFSIDAPSGEFLGECGVGVSENIGVGDPKKVTAFEVWLFDKNDIQTVTKVLMSRHAFEDAETRQKLASKGEPVMVEPNKTVILETATLQLEARVVDTSYGQSALPTDSYFERMTLELAVWQKQAK